MAAIIVIDGAEDNGLQDVDGNHNKRHKCERHKWRFGVNRKPSEDQHSKPEALGDARSIVHQIGEVVAHPGEEELQHTRFKRRKILYASIPS